jgi:phosphoribosylaminoimidazole (AIR) synthetase
MVFIVDSSKVERVKDALKELTEVYEIGVVESGDKNVSIN